RRNQGPFGRRSGRGFNESKFGGRGQGRQVPRGPLLSTLGGADRYSSLARAKGRYPDLSRSFYSTLQCAFSQERRRYFARRYEAVGELLLAGQRSGIEKRCGAGNDLGR